MSTKKPSYGIVGGGVAGLCVAYELLKKENEVTVFDDSVGGLAAGFEDGSFLEKYYHHFFLNDEDLWRLLRELGLDREVLAKAAPMGFYVDGHLYPFATPVDLLRFRPLPLHDRVRLGLLIFYFQKSKRWRHLDAISVKDWVTPRFGHRVYETVWEPLLKLKFGRESDRIPASWLWGRIHPRAQSRSGMKEKLCYPRGSFQRMFDRLSDRIREMGGKIVKERVQEIRLVNRRVSALKTGSASYSFDRYISTVPNPTLLGLAKGLPAAYASRLASIKYFGIVCMKVFLKKPLGRFYWVNISDKRIPFAGLIEHTNLMDRKEYGNRSVIYLFNYIPQDHPLWRKTDGQIFRTYVEGMKLMFPKFREKDVVSFRLDRARYATPVYDMRYLKKKPPFRTPLDNLFLLNTSQLYPEDRNVNHGVMYAKRLASMLERVSAKTGKTGRRTGKRARRG